MPDNTNHNVWVSAHAEYLASQNWLDRGERVAVWSAVSAVRNTPILDVGVGAGRSAGLLGMLSAEYVGVDYVDVMVSGAQREYPEVDIRWGDARSLDFADCAFQLVFFGNTGLDSLSHADRKIALNEMYRVLAPGGIMIYSTLNRLGPFYKAGPGPIPATPGGRVTPYRVARFIYRSATRPSDHLHGFRNIRRNRGLFEDHGTWAVNTMPTHEWGLVVHYVTSEYARAEAAAVGLGEVCLLDRDGSEIRPGALAPHTPWIYVVSVKSRGAGAS